MTIERTRLKHPVTGKQLSPETLAKDVLFDSGKDLESLYGEIEGDIFSPTIVQESAIAKLGEGVNVDVSQNVQDGAFKSAILKGCTLVNVANKSFNKFKVTSDGSSYVGAVKENTNGVLKVGVKYIAIFTVTTNAQDSLNRPYQLRTYKDGTGLDNIVSSAESTTKLGFQKVIFDVLTDGANKIGFYTTPFIPSGVEITLDSLVILEYQDGMENWDIPYFTGMSSVKMPVLKSIGKNLFDSSKVTTWWLNRDFWSHGAGGLGNKSSNGSIGLQFKKLEDYNFRVGETYISNGKIAFYDESMYSPLSGVIYSGNAFKIPVNATRFSLSYQYSDSTVTSIVELPKIQLEQGTVATPFEPYKSNILSCLEPVELGGVGDVQDTLNWLTGEVVESTKEIVLNGSENWLISLTKELTQVFYLKFNGVTDSAKILCDTLPSRVVGDVEKISTANNEIYIALLKNKASTVSELKQYLKQNPITVRYELAEKAHKTVDLSGRLWGYKGGHLQISNGFEGKMTYNNGFIFPYEVNISKVTTIDGVEVSISNIENNGTSVITLPACTNATDYIVTCAPVQSLLPSIEYQVATSRTGQITQNTNVLMQHDKKIYSLEMMLMSSSVEDAYQRYLLQNDVQVIRFSTNANGANSMRYYMLSRLIEEELYEQDDMLDKLNVFMMYDEITFEQYFELSDIVLGLNIDGVVDGEYAEVV